MSNPAAASGTLVAAVGTALFLVLFYSMVHVVKPGQLGLVFRSLGGGYLSALRPGFWIVGLGRQERIVVVATGANGLLALPGRASAELDPELPPRPVKIAEREILARSQGHIAAGSKVRVIEDDTQGTVVVAAEAS
ncbi:MAG TPA: hypothetical protein VGP88_07775 [Thermoplasmata archaeon]|jgi:membrane-bound ClpP family serine protease|nr:hypothetical protein [Thermoplasmata archaeon]